MGKLPQAPRCYFDRLVFYGGELVRAGISPTKVTSFAYREAGGEKVGVTDVYVREERAINEEGLTERLLGGIHRLYAEDEMKRPELTVTVNEDLRSKNKIQVSYMNHSDVLREH